MTTLARLPGVAAGLVLGAIGPVALVAHAHFARPIGAESGAYEASGVVLVFAFGAPVTALLGYLLATRSTLVRLRAVAAWLAALGAAIVFCVAAPRSGEVRRDDVVRSMPVAGALTANGAAITVGALSVDVREHSLSGDCFVVVTPLGHRGFETTVRNGHANTCPPARVRYDATNEIAVVENVPLWRSPYDERAWDVIAVHSTRDGRATSLEPRVLRNMLRVPPTWASIAAFSSALALALLSSALVQRRRASRFAALVDADHEGDGWFALGDGSRFRVPSASELVLGPFAVRLVEPSTAGSYRASAAATIEPVHPGQPDEIALRAREIAGTHEGVALAAAAVGMMPALAALAVVMS